MDPRNATRTLTYVAAAALLLTACAGDDAESSALTDAASPDRATSDPATAGPTTPDVPPAVTVTIEEVPPPKPDPDPEPTPEPEPETQPEPKPQPPPAAPQPQPEPPAPQPQPDPDVSFPASLAGQDLEVIPTDRRVVALTFDAGANADAVPSILDTLAREGITSTFFLTGNFVRNFPELSRSIVDAGHRMANHSVTHPAFTGLSDAQLRSEVLDAERQIRDVTGADPRPHFRFPLGDRDARTIRAVNDLGYVAVRWTVDTLGWQGTSGGRSAAEVTKRVLDTARPGQIVLLHVGSHPTDGSMLDAEALPSIISGLRDRNYDFVTLDILIT